MVATAALADELKQHNIKYWNDLLNYKFILEMADDSLPIEKFAGLVHTSVIMKF
jgi:thiaminase